MAHPRSLVGGFSVSLVLLAACGGGVPTSTRSAETDASSAIEAPPPRSGSAAPAGSSAASASPAASSSAAPVADAPVATEEELVFSTGGTGKLPATTIRKVLRDKLSAYTACYQMAHDKDPAFKGRFVAHFRIEKAGSVANVEIRGKKTDATFSSCLADQIGTLRFPKPKGGEVQVVYPLDFSEQ